MGVPDSFSLRLCYGRLLTAASEAPLLGKGGALMRQAVLAVLFVGLCSSAYAESAKPMAIEVFPFELEDKSAGAGD